MASEVIKLNLIPKGEMPVFHASQFDTGRLITCELYRGEDAYSVPEGYTVELHCRKVDNNIVTMASTLINDNVVTFTSTEQLTACNGKNLCEVAILDEGYRILDEGYRIGTLNFILEVEVDPLKGGITSTSEIHNLETQIEEITTEIVGENYYNKTEVDDLLDTKADADSVYTIGEVNSLLSGKANTSDVYTKSQTDTLLSAKANSSDVYTKGQVDTALAGKADASSVTAALATKADKSDTYTKGQVDTALAAKADASTVTAALATKADKSDTYTKEQVDALIDNIFPTLTASGAVATFTTALSKPLVSVTAAAGANTVTICGINVWNGNKTDNVGVNATTGNLYASTGTFTTDFIRAKPGASYYANPANWKTWVCFYNATQTYTSYSSISNGVFTVPDTAVFMRISGDMNETATASLNLPSSYTDYHEYTGNTVPVADATTLETKAGINHVYADAGDITVQYKYMSI